MDGLNFITFGLVIIFGIWLIYRDMDIGILVIIFAMVFSLGHTIAFFSHRYNHDEWMYKVEKLHRNPAGLTQHKVDSINERIHRIQYENKGWYRGQFIPNSIDTLSFFELNTENK